VNSTQISRVVGFVIALLFQFSEQAAECLTAFAIPGLLVKEEVL